MDGFARRKEQSKEDIRVAAWELFSQFGVDKVSMTDVARKAGVSQATMVESLVNRVQEIVVSEHTYREKMTAFFQFISAMMRGGKPSPSGSAIFTSSLDLQNDPEINEIRMKAQEKMITLLFGLIEEGRQQRQVDAEPSQAALRIYFTVFMDAFTHGEFQYEYARNPHLVDELGALMMYGLKGK
jgi:hypothetical protein